MSNDASAEWNFETERLVVGPWHEVADRLGVDLSQVIAEMLTARTTVALPASWQGEQSVEGARVWINDRDSEATMLLVATSASQQPVGLLVIAEVTLPGGGIDLRIGYLFAESSWGQGLASELVSGLIDSVRTRPRIRTLSGGVDLVNGASKRVLEKCGFALIDDNDRAEALYQLEISPSNEWDSYALDWDSDGAARAYASAAFESLEGVLHSTDIALAEARVIDFGCGTGLLTERIVAAGATVEAVDTSPAMLDVVEAKIAERNWTGVRTAMSLPAEHEAFDLAVCSSVCSFLDDYPATVKALTARLRDGGLFIQWDWERTDEDSHGLTRTEIRNALADAGLTDVTVGQAFRVLFDDMTMSPAVGHGQRPFGIAPR